MKQRSPRSASIPTATPSTGLLLQEMLAYLGRAAEGPTLQMMQRAGLTLPQLVSMSVLDATGVQTISTLADELHLTRGSVSRLVDDLVMQRLVTRAEGAEDRRHKQLHLTSAGRRLLARLQSAKAAEFDAGIGVLPDALKGELARVLGTVVEALRARPGGPCAKVGGGR